MPRAWFAALAMLVIAACGGDSSGASPAAFTDADGATLYAEACATCHGVDLRGTDRGPPFIHEIYRPGHHGDVAFLLAVRQGVRPHHWTFGPMLPVRGLSDEQVAAITEFVRERQRAQGIE